MTIHTITADCATMARREGDYIYIPLNDPYNSTEYARIHVSNRHRLSGEMDAQAEGTAA